MSKASPSTSSPTSPTLAVPVVVGDGEHAAHIFLPAEHIDQQTRAQVEAMTRHPAVAHARIMPDCHKGNGCCVGFTSQLTSVITPQLIGGDIGCGISSHPVHFSTVERKNGLEKINKAILGAVPMGNGHGAIHSRENGPVIQLEQYEPFLEEATEELANFCAAYKKKFGVDLMEAVTALYPQVSSAEEDDGSNPSSALKCDGTFAYSIGWMLKRIEALKIPLEVFLCNMGTLGGGNHFVELGELQHPAGEEPTGNDDVSTPQYMLVCHTGSRCLGQAVYLRWSSVQRSQKDDPAATPPSSPSSPANDDAELLPFDASLVLSKPEDVAGYYVDMIFAQMYARMNRTAILSGILQWLHHDPTPFDGSVVVNTVHNYIDFHDLVVRKGAVRAHENESCIIALNMRDGIWMCKGQGLENWNRSAAHGCGRVLSRTKAKAGKTKSNEKGTVGAQMKKFKQEMEGIVSDCVTSETLDERPSAYRDSSLVKQVLEHCKAVEILAHYKTIVSAKGA